jgi:hypothetical protein
MTEAVEVVGLRLGIMSSEGKESSGKEEGSDSGDSEDGSRSVIRRIGNWRVVLLVLRTPRRKFGGRLATADHS